MSAQTSDRRPRQVRTWMEEDIHTPWRRLLILRPGHVKWVKRATNRRERRQGRREAREALA